MNGRRDRVSVIATVRDERRSVEALVVSVLGQHDPPDEFVIVDAGSTDGTFEVLEARARTDPRLRVLQRPGNRSVGRNAAIAAAAHDVVACIDGGCVAEPGWLARLTAPFADGAEWVAGFYRPVGRTLRATCIGLVMVYVREEVDARSFLPSARSMAFRRDVWARVGGFPEDLDFAEDTLFDERVAAAGVTPVIALDAVVSWEPPSSYVQLWRTLFRWGRGDGRAGLRSYAYRRALVVVGAGVALVAAAAATAPQTLPVIVVLAHAGAAWRTRAKFAWVDGAGKWVHIPLAHVVHTVAGLSGFVVGRTERVRAARRGSALGPASV